MSLFNQIVCSGLDLVAYFRGGDGCMFGLLMLAGLSMITHDFILSLPLKAVSLLSV